jgi:hypothetical protein
MRIIEINVKKFFNFVNSSPNSFTLNVEGTVSDLATVQDGAFLLGFNRLPINAKYLCTRSLIMDRRRYILVKAGLLQQSIAKEGNYHVIYVMNYEPIIENKNMQRIIKIANAF